MQIAVGIGPLTTGNVIQTGTINSGITHKNLLIFRSIVFELVVIESYMLSRFTVPPRIGKIPYGSGALRSLNQNKPSVSISG